MCDISEESVYHPGFDTSKPFERCPRTQLRHILERASEDLNIELLAGLELEFYLISLRESDDEEHIEDHLGPLNDWSTASGLRSGEGNCVEACVQRLQKSGICVEQYHKEGGFRQFEISLGPLPVLCAADKCMQSQEIIKRTAISHGYKATFFPRPFPNRDPSGSHVHLSMTDTTLKPNIEKQIEPDHFLAGILENLPLLCAFSLGSEASYSRVEQGTMGEWVAWGTENRHVPIRRISYQHWEIRCIDSTSNLYLAIGAFIAAGLVGMKGNTPLRWGDCKEHIRNLSEQTKTDLGIVTAMPKDTGSALALLEENVELLDNYVPLELVRLYSILRRKEHNAYAKMSEIQRRSAYLRDY
jgi:glutamine synthetase